MGVSLDALTTNGVGLIQLHSRLCRDRFQLRRTQTPLPRPDSDAEAESSQEKMACVGGYPNPSPRQPINSPSGPEIQIPQALIGSPIEYQNRKTSLCRM